MCHYKTWYHDDECGYVIQCVECNNIQIAYGMLSLNFLMEDFERFRRQIAGCFANAIPGHAEHVKCIVLPTPCEAMNILLSYRELKTLYKMLEHTDSEMRAEQLLECFKRLEN